MFQSSLLRIVGVALYLGAVNAHLAAWHKGMYCLNGNKGTVDYNSYDIVTPLYQLSRSQWWFHHVNGCDEYPPADGDYIELPAGGSFQIEIGSNRAKTSLSYGGRDMSAWPDGNTYPEDYHIDSCIISPNLHAKDQQGAAGTAFAISYESDIKNVTPENLAVFSVRYHTPWKRVVWYDVPAALPACPPGGCICAWGWVPNGCGQPNMYHQPFKCRVVNAKSSTPVAVAKPPVWCEGNPGACTKGAKQMIYWNQAEGNNIAVDGYDAEGDHKSPAYNQKCGFADGAQNDIFAGPPSSGSGSGGGSTPPSVSPSPPSISSAPPSSPPTTTSSPPTTNSSPPTASSSPSANTNTGSGTSSSSPPSSGAGSGSDSPSNGGISPGGGSDSGSGSASTPPNAGTTSTVSSALTTPTGKPRACRRRNEKQRRAAQQKARRLHRARHPHGM